MMTHRKFRRLVALTGLPDAHVRGLLECLWDVAYETGDPFLGDSTDVEAAARWTGRPGDLTAALLAAGGDSQFGYIDLVGEMPSRFAIHDLHDHAPEYVKNRWRRELSRKAAGSRFRGEQDTADPSLTDQRSISDPSVSVTLAPAPAPAPSALQESKSRKDSCVQASPELGKSLLVFPCLRGSKGGKNEWHLLDTFVAELEAAYPGMDVLAESRMALLWLKSNQLKTYAGMPRFLVGWFSRANNSGRFVAKSRQFAEPSAPKTRPIGALDRSGKLRWDGADWAPVEPAAAVSA